MLLKIRIRNFSFQLLFRHKCNVKRIGSPYVVSERFFVPFSAKIVRFLHDLLNICFYAIQFVI